jgi:hypothetical protein
VIFVLILFVYLSLFPSFLHSFSPSSFTFKPTCQQLLSAIQFATVSTVFFNVTFQTLDRFYDQDMICVTAVLNHPVAAGLLLAITVSWRIVVHQNGPYVKPRQQQGAGIINECQHHFQATANKTDIHHHGKTSANAQHDCHVI